MKATDDSDIKKYDEVIAKGQKGYAPLAALVKASIQNNQEKTSDAAKTLDQVISSASYDTAFREKAKIDKAYLLMNNKGDQKQILSLLNDTSGKNAVFRSTALELKADYLLQIGDKKQASEILTMLAKDAESPVTLQDRAKHKLATLN